MARPLRFVFCGILIISGLWALPMIGQNGARNGEWRAYGSEEGSSRYSPLDQINRDNIKGLQIAWTWKFDNYGSRTKAKGSIGRRARFTGAWVTGQTETMNASLSLRRVFNWSL
jgi:hypothetical protein